MSHPIDHAEPLRSLLFIPAHRTSWPQKAVPQLPDAIILDLEDSVPAEHRGMARAAIREIARSLATHGIRTVVRINALDAGGDEDLRHAVGPELTAVMLPKARTAQEIRQLADLLSYHEGASGTPHGQVGILCIPETAEGMRNSHELASASSRMRGLQTGVAGPVVGDIARAAGFQPSMEGTEQLYLQSRIVLDSRAAGATNPVAGIYGTPIDDLAGVELLVRRARRLGFAGAAVMHPTHLPIVHQVFRPSPEEVDYNKGLIAALEEARTRGEGAVRYRGVMVDFAMLAPAQQVVQEAERLAARASVLKSTML